MARCFQLVIAGRENREKSDRRQHQTELEDEGDAGVVG
jgi:hypothetical protein